MTLYIYRLQGCKICTERQSRHNELDRYMQGNDIEVVGVLFGMVNGEPVVPFPQHDDLCRKENDPMKYQAPVYILETENTVIKLPDIDAYPNIKEYSNAVVGILNSSMDSSGEE